MAALTDVSFGLANEGTFKTYATPTRWYEVYEPDFDVNKHVKQGQGLRVGSRTPRSARRVLTALDAAGSHGVELTSKGMGLLWESILGTGTSTLVSGTTYQQLFTPATGTTVPSRTLQTGVVDSTGTVNAVSYLGSMVDSWELEIGNDAIATLKVTWDCADYTTAQAYAAQSYPAAPTLFHFALVSATLGGSVTVPTTTALASGGTAATNLRSLKLSGGNNPSKARFNFGGAGRKARQLITGFAPSGEIEVEYTDNTVRDAYLNETELPLSVTLTSAEALSTGFATFQLVLPAIKLNGEMPKGPGDDVPVLKSGFDVLDNLTAAFPMYVVHRTADNAL